MIADSVPPASTSPSSLVRSEADVRATNPATTSGGINDNAEARVRAGVRDSGIHPSAAPATRNAAVSVSRPGSACQSCGGSGRSCSSGIAASRAAPARSTRSWHTGAGAGNANQAAHAASAANSTASSAAGAGDPPPPSTSEVASSIAHSPKRARGTSIPRPYRRLPVESDNVAEVISAPHAGATPQSMWSGRAMKGARGRSRTPHDVAELDGS
jgi:hypothetical protein